MENSINQLNTVYEWSKKYGEDETYNKRPSAYDVTFVNAVIRGMSEEEIRETLMNIKI